MTVTTSAVNINAYTPSPVTVRAARLPQRNFVRTTRKNQQHSSNKLTTHRYPHIQFGTLYQPISKETDRRILGNSKKCTSHENNTQQSLDNHMTAEKLTKHNAKILEQYFEQLFTHFVCHDMKGLCTK